MLLLPQRAANAEQVRDQHRQSGEKSARADHRLGQIIAHELDRSLRRLDRLLRVFEDRLDFGLQQVDQPSDLQREHRQLKNNQDAFQREEDDHQIADRADDLGEIALRQQSQPQRDDEKQNDQTN